MAAEPERLVATIPVEQAGRRLDQVLAELFPDYSRSCLARWVREGHALVDASPRRPRDRVWGGERVELRPSLEPREDWGPEDLPLTVIHEDTELLVIDKPAGLVVHPGAGNRDGTLVNALLHHDSGLAAVPRAGVVHRLDKDTTGLLVVARTLRAHASLVAQLKARNARREYDAVVHGRTQREGRIEAPVGRHPNLRTRMAVVASGRPAATRYRVVERFRDHTYLRLSLETGRTHQIRVHMAHIGHPLVGDPTYGGRAARGEQRLSRQALHASRLEVLHPASGEPVAWSSPVPADIRAVIEDLRGAGATP
jgi:23S rRNA pseudouridine1911/1915/1917 synthase